MVLVPGGDVDDLDGIGDLLAGEIGNDTMTGGMGLDTLTGGMGNDVYVWDGQDAVIEQASESLGPVILVVDPGGLLVDVRAADRHAA